jgi:RNA polymerase sigma factor (sigma-70 family)
MGMDALAATQDRDVGPLSIDRRQLISDHLHLTNRVARWFVGIVDYRIPIEDLKQEAFIALDRSARQYDPGGGASFETFAIRGMLIRLRRTIAKTWRKVPHIECNLQNDEERENEPLSKGPSPADTAIGRELWSETMKWLHPRQQELIQLVYGEGLNLTDAAERLGISPKRVQQLHSKIINRLKRRLSKGYQD